jgi:hypothetical protein
MTPGLTDPDAAQDTLERAADEAGLLHVSIIETLAADARGDRPAAAEHVQHALGHNATLARLLRRLARALGEG